jgi:hypothetical protein
MRNCALRCHGEQNRPKIRIQVYQIPLCQPFSQWLPQVRFITACGVKRKLCKEKVMSSSPHYIWQKLKLDDYFEVMGRKHHEIGVLSLLKKFSPSSSANVNRYCLFNPPDNRLDSGTLVGNPVPRHHNYQKVSIKHVAKDSSFEFAAAISIDW